MKTYRLSTRWSWLLAAIGLVALAACVPAGEEPASAPVSSASSTDDDQSAPTATPLVATAPPTLTAIPQPPAPPPLPVLGLSPEINNEVWINSDRLLTDDLRGKVVLVEFWTFG